MGTKIITDEEMRLSISDEIAARTTDQHNILLPKRECTPFASGSAYGTLTFASQ